MRTWKGTTRQVEAGGQGPAPPGRPLTRRSQPLLPSAPTVPEVGGRALGDGDRRTPARSPSPPPRAGLPQPGPAGEPPEPRPPRLGVPRSRTRPGSRLVTREEGGAREQPAEARKRHIRSRKDPPPEQPLFGQRLIWSGSIWAGCFRLREEGTRRRGGGGKGRGQPRDSGAAGIRERPAAASALGFREVWAPGVPKAA